MVTIEEQELTKIIEQATLNAMYRFNRKDKLYSINSIAKRLGVSHTTIKKLAFQGVIRTTKDGKFISEESINEYLKNKEQR